MLIAYVLIIQIKKAQRDLHKKPEVSYSSVTILFEYFSPKTLFLYTVLCMKHLQLKKIPIIEVKKVTKLLKQEMLHQKFVLT